MSYQNKPGKTSKWRRMVIRQQVSAAIANGKLITTFPKAKEASRHIDRLITLAKNPTLANKRRIISEVIDVNENTQTQIMNKALEIAKKMSNKNGGYTRVLKLGKRQGDNTEEAILEFTA